MQIKYGITKKKPAWNNISKRVLWQNVISNIIKMGA